MTRAPSPEIVEAAKEFRRVFMPYFPGLTPERAMDEMNWLGAAVFANPIYTIRRAQLFKDVKRFHKATDTVVGLDELENILRRPLGWVSTLDNNTPNEVRKDARQVLRVLWRLRSMHEKGRLAPAMKAIDKWINVVADEKIGFPQTQNINWEAVHAVEGLRTLWKRNMARRPPARPLNPETRFANYLRAGFEYLELDADPVSAFKRWTKIRHLVYPEERKPTSEK